LFTFPLNEPELCAQWVTAVNRKNWIPLLYSKICELYFEIDFYNTSKRKRLKPVVPKLVRVVFDV
ncbi:THAP1 protein, partial [Acromyrmex heyeri]